MKRRASLWCKVLQRRIRVILVKKVDASGEAWIPEGWGLQKCLDQGFECVGKECPFSVVCGSGKEEMKMSKNRKGWWNGNPTRETGKRVQPMYERVACIAYGLYEQRGRQDGHDQEDWFRAEEIIRRENATGKN